MVSNDTLLRAVRHRGSSLPPLPSASTIGFGDAISATACSSVTSNEEGRSRSCLIESPRPSSGGCGNGPISRSSRVIAAARMPWPRGEHCPTPLNYPIAGISGITRPGADDKLDAVTAGREVIQCAHIRDFADSESNLERGPPCLRTFLSITKQ